MATADTTSKLQTILVVEPSSVTRQLIADVLNNAGYKVIYAVDAKDAVYKLNDEKPDLVLTDTNISVFELLDQLKKTGNCRFTPVALLVDKSDEARKKNKTYTINHWIEKPFSPESLLEGIRKFM